MQDEGVGTYFVNYIKKEIPDADVIEAGNINLSLVSEIENKDCVIFVDAIRMDYPEEFVWFEIKDKKIPVKFSFHEIGIRELIGILELMGKSPKRIFVFGIRPMSIAPGLGLSPELKEKLCFLKDIFLKYYKKL